MGMWHPGDGQGFVKIAESVAADADADPFSRWIAGVIFAAIVAGFGVVHFVAAAGWPPLHWLFKVWHVREASSVAAVGWFLLALAVFMHAHFFWTPHPRWHALGRLGKIIGALVIAILLLIAAIGGVAGFIEVPWPFRRR